MPEVFISYARSTEAAAKHVADALRAVGYAVWRDDELPAHRDYAEVIEERLRSANAVVVVWSAEAVKSQWVQSEADRARIDRKLVQLTIDGAAPPMPFDRIQCADMTGWSGDLNALGWKKVAESVAELIAASAKPAAPAAQSPPTPALPSGPSIAVIPFANLSSDPEQDYFADGVAAEITGVLSRSNSLLVIASGSTSAFRNSSAPPQEIGRVLGVRYLLNGNVRKAGGRVRIAVNLIDTASGAQLWTDRFEDTLDDIFALQDRVAQSVANAADAKLWTVETQRAAAQRPTADMGAYDLYLRAGYLIRGFDLSSMAPAVEMLDRAIALDPEFVAVLTLAAFCHATLAADGSGEAAAHQAQARQAMKRALEIAPNDAEVLSSAADIYTQLGDDPATVQGMVERAIELGPGRALPWFVSGWMRVAQGELDGGIERLQSALRLDPVSRHRPAVLCWLGIAAYAQERDADAVRLLTESHQLFSGYPLTLPLLAAAHGQLGDVEEARSAMAALRATNGLNHGWMRRLYRVPAHRQRFRQGIAKAEAMALTGSADA
jgi:adenylate cyclase